MDFTKFQIRLWLVYAALAFPLFYFSYKFLNPEPIAHDFFQYYRLYKDFEIENVVAPLNMRLVGAFFVWLFYNVFNLHYETQTAFDYWTQFGFIKQVYFCAMFFNFLCVSATCALLYTMARRYAGNSLSFLAGAAYLLGFGTLFYCIAPVTEAFSVFLFTVALYWYFRKSYLVIVALLLLVFQREYLILAFLVIAFVDAVSRREKYHLVTFGACVLAFALYLLLRLTVFYNSALDLHLQPGNNIALLVSGNYQWAEYFRQTLLTMNLPMVYGGILIWKRFKSLPILKWELVTILLLFVQVNAVSLLAGSGTNNGRYFYLVVPFVIITAIRELSSVRFQDNHS